MKGVILVGGSGSRLDPLTRVANKHLLPVYDRPMVFYPIQALVNAGVSDIMLVTGGNNAGDFLRLLGNGSEFGLKRLHYTYQDRPAGIAHALGLARDFAEGDTLLLMLGDNIIEGNLLAARRNFEAQRKGAGFTSMTSGCSTSFPSSVLPGAANWRSPMSTTTTSRKATWSTIFLRASGRTAGSRSRLTWNPRTLWPSMEQTS